MTIHVLPPDVAAKIAAGEVVERPANVAKELLENSLDAGATEIRVEIREGGARLLRVADDGHGIPTAEAGLAFQRHATSKLATADDLAAIGTFGFRGEALYSIAAVSQVTLVTATQAESAGVQVRVVGGKVEAPQKAGTPQGTIVTVEHLFFNMPARKKFLRKPATEAGQIAAIVQRYALAHPERRFTLINEGRTVFQTTGSGDLYDVLVQLYGLESAKQMVPVGSQPRPGQMAAPAAGDANLDSDVDFMAWTGPVDEGPPRVGENGGTYSSSSGGGAGIRIGGYASLPSLSRANRTAIELFVNRRYIEDRNLTYAVIRAYHTLLPQGRYPIAVVMVEIDPAEVDVNVHPQKTQVRFVDAPRVQTLVQRAVQQALLGRTPAPGMRLPDHGATVKPKPWTALDSWSRRRPGAYPDEANSPAGLFDAHGAEAPSARGGPAWPVVDADAGDAVVEDMGFDGSANSADMSSGADSAAETTTETATENDSENVSANVSVAANAGTGEKVIEVKSKALPPLRVVGQVGTTYIVAEGPEGLFLIDQHAAHERILYEQFMARRFGTVEGGIAAQHLLEPLTLHVGHELTGLVAEHLDALRAVGYEVEAFGGDAFLVRAVPNVLSDQDPLHALSEIVATLGDRRNRVGETFEERLVKMVCKRAAIKAGQQLSVIEMRELVRQLEECRAPRTCPHGRPTMIQLSAGELEKAFGRV
ncbi:MAG: DNA mismatch repair endonuclease MutL [Litorilinea sp.]